MLDPFLLLELELTLLGRQVFYLLVQCLSFLIKHGFDFAQLGHDDLVDLACLRLLLLGDNGLGESHDRLLEANCLREDVKSGQRKFLAIQR